MSRHIILLAAASVVCWPSLAAAEPVHGIAMHGEVKLPRDFQHFPYVNPQAPKGGRITLGVTGSFDSLSPLIVRGEAGHPAMLSMATILHGAVQNSTLVSIADGSHFLPSTHAPRLAELIRAHVTASAA